MTNRVVYADTPGQAFSLNSELDSRAIQNFLNSTNANRNAAQSAFAANSQVANQQRQDEQNQFANALQLLQTRSKQEIAAQNRMDAFAQFAAQLGLTRADQAETRRHNMATEERPNASLERGRLEAAAEAKFNEERAGKSEALARYLEEQRTLKQMLGAIPGSVGAQSTSSAVASAYKRPSFLERLTTFDAGHGRDKELLAEAMRSYAADTPYDLPANFSGADSLPAMYEARKAAINTRLGTLDALTKGADISDMVELGPDGKFMSRFRRSPGNVFTQGTGTTGPVSAARPAAQTQTVTTAPNPRREQIMAEAQAAIAQGADPAKVAARVDQLLKGL